MNTPAKPQRIVRPLATLSLLALLPLVTASAQAGVTVGLHFVEGQDEPIDFMTIPGFPAGHYIQPWQMTAPDTEFVTDGAFQGLTEQEAQAAVVAAVKDRYYSIPTPQGYVLDIDFQNGAVSGPGTVNVLIGKHNLQAGYNWFGFTALGGGLGTINGESNSAVSLDRINDLLQLDFVQLDDALNAISNVITHEVGHLFWLEHVWADERPDLGWQVGDPVASNPYDVMSTAPSGLPEAGWIEKNVFTTVPGTQSGGQSSVDKLIANLGLRRIGDLNGDDDVDNQDIVAASGAFTGAAGSGSTWDDGDMDHDGDVDNADLVSLIGAFTGAAAGNLTDTPGLPDLIYDPSTGSVTLDADGGPDITNFQLESAGQFISANYISQSGGGYGGVFEDISDSVLADSDLAFVGLATLSLGNVFPTGLDAVNLQALLSTAVYGAGLGNSGEFDLVIVGAAPFELGIEIAPVPTGFELTWTNRAFKAYDIERSTDLQNWAPFDPDGPGGVDPLVAIAYSGSDTNTITITSPGEPGLFFRVVENPALLFAENFDSAAAIPAGWTTQVGGTAPTDTCVWEVGAPSSPAGSDGSVGPPAAFSGTNCAGTNIDFYCKRDDVFAAGPGGTTNNDYESVEVSLITPVIAIPAEAPSALLSFQQFMDTPGRLYETATITVLDADNADAPISGLEIVIPFGEDDTEWQARTLELPVLGASGVAGKNIKVKFYFDGNPYIPNQGQKKLFVRTGTNPDFYSPVYTSSFGGGLYIDDVEISIPFVP